MMRLSRVCAVCLTHAESRYVAATVILTLVLGISSCGGTAAPASPSPAPAPAPIPEPAPPPTPPPVPSPSPSPEPPEPEPEPPTVSFGPGQHRVGAAIPAGRYYSDPSPGCYWERQSGTGGTSAETIAFDFVGFDAAQWIVDILPSDHSFLTNAACGTWTDRPRVASPSTIAPGMWLVGTQATAATYRTTAGAGCNWERLRDFAGTTESVIAGEFVGAAGTAFVTIASTDAGFGTDAACGTWTPTEALGPANGLSRITR